MSDTPRTDAATRMAFSGEYMVPIEDAQKLERELAEVKNDLDFRRDLYKLQEMQLAEVIKQREDERKEAANKAESIQIAANRIDELKNRSDHWCDMHTIAAKERDEIIKQRDELAEALNKALAEIGGGQP